MAPAGPMSCANHADRPAIARCMGCHKPICQECSTPWEGIHHCVACLAERRAEGGRRGSAAGWIAVVTAVAVLSAASVYLMVVFGVLLAGIA